MVTYKFYHKLILLWLLDIPGAQHVEEKILHLNQVSPS
jgi:hypothetical protein